MGYGPQWITETGSQAQCLWWTQHLQDRDRRRLAVGAGIQRRGVVLSRERDDPAQRDADSPGELFLPRSDEDREGQVLAVPDGEHHPA